MSKAGESLLLDSSVIVFGFKSHPAVLDVLDQSVQIHVPVIAYGELYNGALKSQAPEKKLKQLGEFIKWLPVTEHKPNYASRLSNKPKRCRKKPLFFDVLLRLKL